MGSNIGNFRLSFFKFSLWDLRNDSNSSVNFSAFENSFNVYRTVVLGEFYH